MQHPFLLGTALAREIQSSTQASIHLITNDTGRVYHSWKPGKNGIRFSAPFPGKRGSDLVEEENNEAFSAALSKGVMLMKAMMADDRQAAMELGWAIESAESKFVDFKDLETWGYGIMEYDEYYDFDASLPIKPALEAIGIAAKKLDEGGTNRAVTWEHEEETTHDGKTCPPTHASYTAIFNPEDGLIIGWGAFSPTHMGLKQDPPVSRVPELKQWSDSIFLQWAHLCSGERIRNLRFVMRTPCENSITQEIIMNAMKRTKQQLMKWPGVTFRMGSEEGKAILGSPTGWGVAFMLVQHKRQLGNKVVEKVTVFQDEGRKQPRPPSVLFYIKNYEIKQNAQQTG